MDSNRAAGPGSKRQSAAMSGSSPAPDAAAPGGPSTPNCQRAWFLAEARYGYSRYPS